MKNLDMSKLTFHMGFCNKAVRQDKLTKIRYFHEDLVHSLAAALESGDDEDVGEALKLYEEANAL